MGLPGETYFVLCFLAVFSVVGAVGNALVIHVYRHKREKHVSSVFILTLAVVDLSTCILVIPYTIYMEASGYMVYYDFLCKLYQFLLTCNIPFSAFVMVAIAVDRYLCICHPFVQALTPWRAVLAVLVLALLSGGLGVITALIYGVYHHRTFSVPANGTLSSNSTSSTTGFLGFTKLNSTVASIPASVVSNVYNDSIVPTLSSNTTSVTSQSEALTVNVTRLVYTGKCDANLLLIGMDFLKVYQKVYYTMFVLDLVVVVVLYVMIYNSVVTRRSKRQRQKSTSLALVSMQEDVTMDTDATMCVLENGADSDKGETSPTKDIQKPLKAKKYIKRKASKSAKWDKNAVANIRTAAMLFVVTIVFIVTYLPPCLMALQVIPYSMTVFYLYFFNFIANPLIYAFMNKTFRDDLRRLLDCS